MPKDKRPIKSYGLLTGLYFAGMAGVLASGARADKLPERMALADVLLLGAATHKLSRTITKDRVTAPVRAPFTEYEGEAGPGEVEERPEGRGMQRAVGELISCPYCIGAWVSGALTAGLVYAPRATRVVSAAFAALAISDFLQVAYKVSEKHLET